jgi:hypothetical protein
MQKPDSWNGPGREVAVGELEFLEGVPAVYCTTCGTIFVIADDRDCPSCHNRKSIEDLEERINEIEKILDHRFDEIHEDIKEVKRTTGILAEVQEGDHDD